jgi:hypothetical protein
VVLPTPAEEAELLPDLPPLPAAEPPVPMEVLLEPLPAVVLPRPSVEAEPEPEPEPLPAAEPPVPSEVLVEPLPAVVLPRPSVEAEPDPEPDPPSCRRCLTRCWMSRCRRSSCRGCPSMNSIVHSRALRCRARRYRPAR